MDFKEGRGVARMDGYRMRVENERPAQPSVLAGYENSESSNGIGV